jgi:hypothetical protein
LVDADQLKRVVELAGRYHEEAVRCELTALARQVDWLPALGSGEPRDLSESEVGDAVEFVRWLRNLAAHPGRHIRDAARVHLGEVAPTAMPTASWRLSSMRRTK